MQRQHPPGTIGISLGEMFRYVQSYACLTSLKRPDDSRLSTGWSISVSENMNGIIRNMPEDHDWLHIQADDHLYPNDLLFRLLDLELDVVVPLVVRRGPPFITVLNKGRSRGGWKPFSYDEIPHEPFKVHTVGTGGMLIRKRVLDAIVEKQGHDRVFEVRKGDKLNEDYVLCDKIRKAGFQIWCDPRITMGHIGNFAVWPEWSEDRWRLRFDLGQAPDGRVSHVYFETKQEDK